jgi:hypothetical protein
MNESKEMTVIDAEATIAVRPERSVDDVVKEVDKVKELMSRVMKKDTDYGVIPGTKGKPTLLKPGAELLCKLFRLSTEYPSVEIKDMGDGHIWVRVKCRLVNNASGEAHEGIGSCSTLESRYRWRVAERSCPSCDQKAIIKGKPEYGGGWLCFKKKGGCGAKFAGDAPEITTQPRGRVENPDIADVYNTVEKMAAKRAKVDATLSVTAASSLFTQDLEDFSNGKAGPGPEPEKEQAPPDPDPGYKPPADVMMSTKQAGMLAASARELSQITASEVNSMVRGIYKDLDVKVESRKELTMTQASKVINEIAKRIGEAKAKGAQALLPEEDL